MDILNTDISYGDWVYLKNNPDVEIKVELINPNGIVDFRRQRSEYPKSANISDLIRITDEQKIYDLERKYHQPS